MWKYYIDVDESGVITTILAGASNLTADKIYDYYFGLTGFIETDGLYIANDKLYDVNNAFLADNQPQN